MATEPVVYEAGLKNSGYNGQLRRKVRAKQRILQQEWLKTENYKTENSIVGNPNRSKSRREKYIISKIRQSRPNTSNHSYLSSVFSRHDTYTSTEENA